MSDKKKTDKISLAQAKLREDTTYFNRHERIEHLELLSTFEKRLVQFLIRHAQYRNSVLRYFNALLYFMECLSQLSYAKKRKNG